MSAVDGHNLPVRAGERIAGIGREADRAGRRAAIEPAMARAIGKTPKSPASIEESVRAPARARVRPCRARSERDFSSVGAVKPACRFRTGTETLQVIDLVIFDVSLK